MPYSRAAPLARNILSSTKDTKEKKNSSEQSVGELLATQHPLAKIGLKSVKIELKVEILKFNFFSIFSYRLLQVICI